MKSVKWVMFALGMVVSSQGIAAQQESPASGSFKCGLQGVKLVEDNSAAAIEKAEEAVRAEAIDAVKKP